MCLSFYCSQRTPVCFSVSFPLLLTHSIYSVLPDINLRYMPDNQVIDQYRHSLKIFYSHLFWNLKKTIQA